jgi:DNA-binding MarR family transcriptional regulator
MPELKSDPLKNLHGYALRRASAASMASLAEQLTPLDLRPTDASVIVTIQANPRIRQSEIGRMLDIRSANMAPLIAKLDQRGLIAREQIDGRSQCLTLTAAGASLASQALAVMHSHDEEMRAQIPEAVRAPLLAALIAIWRAAGTSKRK